MGILVAVALVSVATTRISQAAAGARAGVAALDRLAEEWARVRSGGEPDVDRAEQLLTDAGTQLARAQAASGPALWLVQLVQWVPGPIGDLTTAKDVLAVGRALVSAGEPLLDVVRAVTADEFAGPVLLDEGDQLPVAALGRLSHHEGDLREVLVWLEQASAALDRVTGPVLSPALEGRVNQVRALLPRIKGWVRTGLDVSDAWPAALGFEQPRTYLLVAMNSDELRAAGGFIPGAWLVTLDHGRVSGVEFWDTVDVDDRDAVTPLPPEGIIQSLWGGAWMFRDAGWFPDFPSSAHVMEQLFRLNQGVSVDGVVGVTQQAMGKLLAALGPLHLPSGESLDLASYRQILEDGTDAQDRSYLDIVMQGVLARLKERGSVSAVASLASALDGALAEKSLVLAFHDERLVRVAARHGWDGAVRTLAGDYLMIVDSNVGSDKVNPSIQQQARYEVVLESDGSGRGRLDIWYENHSVHPAGVGACEEQGSGHLTGSSYYAQKQACYWDFLRVYVPAVTRLEAASSFPVPDGALYRLIGYDDLDATLRTYEEGAKAVFAGLFTVAPGQSRAASFAFRLAPGVARIRGGELFYRLLVQKQAGASVLPIDVIVNLPHGYGVLAASPEPILFGRRAVFQLRVDADVSLQLVVSRRVGGGEGEGAPADSVEVQAAPGSLEVPVGGTVLLPAPLVAGGEPLLSARWTWQVLDSSVGSVDSLGVFRAGSVLGHYRDAVQVAVGEVTPAVSRFSVTVVGASPPPDRRLATVSVNPSEVTARPGQVVGLGALGWDRDGRFVQGLSKAWAVEDLAAGTVDQFGFFTASDRPGRYADAVRVTAVQETAQGPVTREAYVTVTIEERADARLGT